MGATTHFIPLLLNNKVMETHSLRKRTICLLASSSTLSPISSILITSHKHSNRGTDHRFLERERERDQNILERNQMGNCQAVDAAALVIQHPNGSLERMYWPVTASEVMKMNPGYHVSVIIPLPISGGGQENGKDNGTVRFTRVKLLRPTDVLVLGRAYRLVTTQDAENSASAKSDDQATRPDRHQQRSGSTKLTTGRPKPWRPSLESISEYES